MKVLTNEGGNDGWDVFISDGDEVGVCEGGYKNIFISEYNFLQHKNQS